MSAYCATFGVTPQKLQAWHTITLLHFKATQTILNSAQDPEFSFQMGFLICFYSQIPALVKPKLTSIETMRLPPGLPHQQQESNSADSVQSQWKHRTPPSSQLQGKCVSYTATFCSHKAGKGWGRGGLLMPHVYLAFCTQGNSFWNSNSLQTASHTWGSLNPVYKISPWAVLTSKQHHRKDISAKVENGALNKK